MNINVAVQTEHGLFVPVIRVTSKFFLCVLSVSVSVSNLVLVEILTLFARQDADKKGLGTIAEEVKQLAQKARDSSLKPADYEVYCAY